MTTTRSSAKKAEGSEDQAAGSKHQLDNKPSPDSKRTKKSEKQQQTLEEVISKKDEPKKQKSNGAKHEDVKNDDRKESEGGEHHHSAIEQNGRDATPPSSILEKGIIYFFMRGRVGIDDPSSVQDIARSYIILRPIEKEAKLGEGSIGDAGNSRLIAIPKKVLPQSGRDRWIAFVEKSSASFKTLKDEFLAASDYETKTAGVRHSPAATPLGEGIYAITTTGRESHLAYMLTIPDDLGEVQKEIGLGKKGSFIISTRNPEYEAPKGTALPEGPDYPQEVIHEFRSLRWMPTNPKHLNYPKTQFLLVGESSGISKAIEPQKDDEKAGTEKPIEELEQLGDEDTHRMKNLSKDDSTAIFTDLEAQAMDYPKLQTTF